MSAHDAIEASRNPSRPLDSRHPPHQTRPNLPAKSIVVALALLLLPALSSTALADDTPRAISVADTDDGAIILVAYDDGVLAVDAQGKTYHHYDFDPSRRGGFELADVNADGKTDYIAMGKRRTFVVGADGDPLWAADGCDLAHVGNFAGDKALEVFCADGRNLRVYGADGTLVWEMSISGMSLGECRLVDLRGAKMADIECKLRGKKRWIQLSGEGSLINDAAEAPSEGNAYTLPTGAESPMGEEATPVDFDGDGRAQETVKLADGDAFVSSGESGSPQATASLEPTAAGAGDLDADGTVEIVLAAAGRVVALDPDAEGTVLFDTRFDRGALERTPEVQLGTVGLYGLDGDEAALRETLNGARDAMASCYTRQIRKNPFLKVGRYSVRAIVSGEGTIDSVEKSYSTLGNEDVESCVDKAIEKLTLLPVAEDADSSYAVVDLVFGYRDK